MQVTIFGANGRVGRQVVALCQQRGYDVVAFVHSSNPFAGQAGIRVVQGDIYDAAAVGQALKGSQAVMSALGSWGTKRKDIVSRAMTAIIPAMQQQGIKRIVTVTGSGALWAGDDARWTDRAGRAVLNTLAPKILLDGERHLAFLAESKLDWTSIRSPVMLGFGTDKYHLRSKLPLLPGAVPRKAVVASMVDQLEATDFVGQAPVIYR